MTERIRATDNEELATELWGDDKKWDDERKQYVPTDANEEKRSDSDRKVERDDKEGRGFVQPPQTTRDEGYEVRTPHVSTEDSGNTTQRKGDEGSAGSSTQTSSSSTQSDEKLTPKLHQ